MRISNRGTYERESFLQRFYRSCLGKIIILATFTIVMLLIALASKPDKKQMYVETIDNVKQSIAANIKSKEDEVDMIANNIAAFFTHADSADAKEAMVDFFKFNRVVVHEHTFFSTTRIYNNIHPGGTRAGIGIFGTVIPTVKYKDLLLYVGTLRKKYNQPIIRRSWTSDPDLGSNPDLGNTHNTYEGGGSRTFD